MKNLIMKPASLVLLFVCLFGTLDARNEVPTLAICGSIVVEGDIMLTEAEEPTATIEEVVLEHIVSGQTFTFSGCGSNACSTDVSRIPNGTYEATVTTSDCTFTATVEKK